MLIDISTSLPPYKITQHKAANALKKVMANSPASNRIVDLAAKRSGIGQRHIVVSNSDEPSDNNFYTSNGNKINPGTGKRMDEYEKWTKLLAKNAVADLLDSNKFDPQKINAIITISCTGFFAPGLDYYLINEFNLPFNIKRINIGFMGCAASIIGINSAMEAMRETQHSQSNILLISVELCSLHLHPEASRDNVVSNMIFADGCAAALFSKDRAFLEQKKLKHGFDIVGTESMLFKDSSEYMGWKIGSYGFEMTLSSELPKIIFYKAVPELLKILEKRKINLKEIKYWALHPGGRAILDSLQKGLNLSEEEMKPSRDVLWNYGNMSSPSILFVLKEILYNNNIKKDELCCAVAFGPGLTMEVALFRGT